MRRIAVIGDMITHCRPQLENRFVTKFGIESSLRDIQCLSKIAPVICHISSAIFDQAHARIADQEPALCHLSRLAEMPASGKSGPVCHREW